MNESIEELLASGAVVPDRPGSKRLVPAAQSVVVPVELVQRAINLLPISAPRKELSAALAAAPAPSSLAGGEVHEAVALEVRMAMQDEMMASDANGGRVSRRIARANRAADTILAALSPEAPAEGVVKACADFQEAIDYFEADVADALAEDSERADLWDREVTVNIDALKTVMNAALTPRHEAPAEPCKSCNGTRRELGSAFNRCADCEAPAEGAGEAARIIACHLPIPETPDTVCLPITMTAGDLRAIYAALRARSSAPEARSTVSVLAEALHDRMFGVSSLKDPALALAEISDGGGLHEAAHELLRALPLRGSAPEAREAVEEVCGLTEIDAQRQPIEALSILRGLSSKQVVVVWKDGTYRFCPALDVPIAKQEDGEVLVVIPLGPEAREGEAVGHAGAMPGSSGFTMAAFKAADVPLGTPLFIHPAAPSADKLRSEDQ